VPQLAQVTQQLLLDSLHAECAQQAPLPLLQQQQQHVSGLQLLLQLAAVQQARGKQQQLLVQQLLCV
jgi:hypothetical protein